MAKSLNQQVASLYSLKSVVDGMTSSVKCGVIDYQKALTVIASQCEELAKKDSDSNGEEAQS